MAIDPLGVLHTGVFLAIVGAMYGVCIGVVWTPFLLAGRIRDLFDSLSPRQWFVDYALTIPVPALVWGFVCGVTLSVSRAIRPPTRASPLYVSGVDAITVATIVSLLIWPAVVLYVLPTAGYRWTEDGITPSTIILVLVGLVWYLLWLVVPTYGFTVLAGFGDTFSAT